MIPSASCWRTFSLSHIRTCMMMSLGSDLGVAWKRMPIQPCDSLLFLKLLAATVSAKTKKVVLSPRTEARRSKISLYSWSSISWRRSLET